MKTKVKVIIRVIWKTWKSVSPKEKKSLKFMVVSMTRNENGDNAQIPYAYQLTIFLTAKIAKCLYYQNK